MTQVIRKPRPEKKIDTPKKIISLAEIERLGKAELKKQETLGKNLAEKKESLAKKIDEIDKSLDKINQQKKKIRNETRKKIVEFAKNNF